MYFVSGYFQAISIRHYDVMSIHELIRWCAHGFAKSVSLILAVIAGVFDVVLLNPIIH